MENENIIFIFSGQYETTLYRFSTFNLIEELDLTSMFLLQYGLHCLPSTYSLAAECSYKSFAEIHTPAHLFRQCLTLLFLFSSRSYRSHCGPSYCWPTIVLVFYCITQTCPFSQCIPMDTLAKCLFNLIIRV